MAGALVMTFANQSGKTASRGPYPAIYLAGESMRAEPTDAPFAIHDAHEWAVNGERFLRAECAGPLTVQLRRLDGSTSKVYGPFQTLSFVDGVAYADRAVFAFVDRSIGDWYCHDDGRHWAALIITPA